MLRRLIGRSLCLILGLIIFFSVTAETLRGNLIKNGDFAQGLESWEKNHTSRVDDRWKVEVSGEGLKWERLRSHNDGGAVGVWQQVNVSTVGLRRLTLKFQVKVSYQSLENSGSWSEGRGGWGETPVRVALDYLAEDGREYHWEHGFLYLYRKAPTIEEVPDPTDFTRIAQDRWSPFEIDLLRGGALQTPEPRKGKILPRPKEIRKLSFFGSGWDFEGGVRKVTLNGE